MKILISGAGIAGPTLAYWLSRHGFKPTLVEKAPQLRTGGYIVDFWGTGFDIADKMALIPEFMAKGYQVREVRMVNDEGRKVGGFRSDIFERMTSQRFTSLPRSEISASIYRHIEGNVSMLWGTEISKLEPSQQGVQVTFLGGKTESYDLVIGADGLHSRVRELEFGAQEKFEKFLGYYVAAFETRDYPHRDEDVYVMYTEVGQQLARFTMRDHRTLFLFIFAEDDPNLSPDNNLQTHRNILRERYRDSRWECPEVLRALDSSSDLYFDRVSQIRMPSWHKGRVGLVGDAAFCISLLGGQGSALAMISAYVLAGELKRANGDYEIAFIRYEELLGAFIRKKQNAAARFGGAFAPKTALGLFARNQITKILDLPFIAEWAIGRDLRDKLEIPAYETE